MTCSGTCPWGPDYRLNYVGGNNKAAQMDGQPVNVVGEVAPGQTYDFYVNLNAPSGVYGEMQGRWQMQDPAKVFFGQTVWVMVNVVAPTPGPTAPPQVTATLPPQATGTIPPQPTQPPPTATQIADPLQGSTFEFYAISSQPTIPGTVLTVAFESGGLRRPPAWSRTDTIARLEPVARTTARGSAASTWTGVRGRSPGHRSPPT